MDRFEEALEKLNCVFVEKITAINTDDTLPDESIKNKSKIVIYENWKNSLVGYTRKCFETIVNSKHVLDKSMSESSDDASKVSKTSYSSENSSHVCRKFTKQIALLEDIIMKMGSRSQEALLELAQIAKLFAKQMHINKLLTQETTTLKSDLKDLRSKSAYYNQLADKILSNMKEESVDLKRFFVEYEKRMESIEKHSSHESVELTRRLRMLEDELTSKNQKITELTLNLQQFGKPSATSTMNRSDSKRSCCSSSAISAKILNSASSESEHINTIALTMHESYETYNLTDVEASDNCKIRTLEDGAATMAKLLKEKHKMLREQKSIIQDLRQCLKKSKEYCVTIDRLQTQLNSIQDEKIHLIEECNKLRTQTDDYDKLRAEFEKITNEQMHNEENFVQKISVQEKQIEKLTEEQKRLIQTNYDFFKSVSIAYKELGNCISIAVTEKIE